ncbi:NADPH-dependent FMN reductase [Actinokineospora diospyrosa]|uniref:FMN reductase n=1 Tax=Actinokineospora diospyrosa TaxID=103728 RepID=A0ABT1I5V7_9PSEU|nr:NADPH-dependent FMN reductase [Actinokineospora diospyrosa]MCP2268015.1 FMN reductase [Actinokineospora diospyrosa]
MPTPLVVGIGGTPRPGSSTDRALARVLASAATHGLATSIFGGAALAELPLYRPDDSTRHPTAHALIEAVRTADAIVLATPGYHGGVSALVKNALDYLEDLRDDTRPYFDSRPVACLVTAAGPQALGSTLTALRSITHALRGWPTPLGVTINTTTPTAVQEAAGQLDALGEQVARMTTALRLELA